MRFLYMCFLALLWPHVSWAHSSGLELAKGWQSEIITECGDDMPDMLMLSADNKNLYQSCETKQGSRAPSLARINIHTGKRDILIYGLGRADGMRFAPDGSLWLGEERSKGLIWRIETPDALKPGQRVERETLITSNLQIQAIVSAGTFSHEGLTFSQDGQYLYLADEWTKGALYRLILAPRQLQVFDRQRGWLSIHKPKYARKEAETLQTTTFNRMEDMELMADGTILIAETGTGKILQLDDSAEKPEVSLFLKHADIAHPDNLEWDSSRGWLWISDDSYDSELWTWDGKHFKRVALHTSAEITGIESGEDGMIYFNLQHRRFAPDLTMKIYQKP